MMMSRGATLAASQRSTAMRRRAVRLFVLAIALLLLVAACADDGEEGAAGDVDAQSTAGDMDGMDDTDADAGTEGDGDVG